MGVRKGISSWSLMGWLIVAGAACGGAQGGGSGAWSGIDETTGQQVTIRQGPMPTGQTFTGVYRSPQIGDVQIVQTGDGVQGRYEYDRGSCHVHATIEGTVSGNQLRFNWTEDHRECGRIEPVRGRGFFLIAVDEGSDPPHARLWGRWGYQADDHGGGPWTAFKIMNQQPTMLQEQSGGATGPGAGDTGGSGGASGGTNGSNGGGLGL